MDTVCFQSCVANSRLLRPLRIEVLVRFELLDEDLSIAFQAFEIALDRCEPLPHFALASHLSFQQLDLSSRIVERSEGGLSGCKFSLDPRTSVELRLERRTLLV